MPNITIELLRGRTPDQRRRLVAEVTDAVVGALAVPPASVRIVLQEVGREDVAVGGALVADAEGA